MHKTCNHSEARIGAAGLTQRMLVESVATMQKNQAEELLMLVLACNCCSFLYESYAMFALMMSGKVSALHLESRCTGESYLPANVNLFLHGGSCGRWYRDWGVGHIDPPSWGEGVRPGVTWL